MKNTSRIACRRVASVSLRGFLPVLSALIPLSLGAGTLDFNIGSSFGGLNFSQGAGWVPPDMGVAVGPTAIVQLVNGGYQSYNKSGGSLTGGQSDISFWINAGISSSLVSGANNLSDPRAVYDPGSGRFFVTEENVTNSASNQVFIAVSNTSNPLNGWKAVSFTANTGFASGFADFPTLGLDQNGVYIGTNNFDNSSAATSVSVFSIPKSDLLLATPSVARLSSFSGLSNSTYGIVPHPVLDSGGTHGAVLTLGPTSGQATLSNISGAGGASATLSSPTVLNGLDDGSVLPPLQSDGSSVTTNIDDRFSATPVIVGNLLYAVNGIGNSTTDQIHWMIMDLTTKLVLQQGTISDPNFFYTYPSISANANGDFVIGFNRSGPTDDMSAYAVRCHYDGTSAACGTPTLLKQGLAVTFDGRWGDYSSTSIDPTSPNVFWTAIEVPLADGTWSTQITELEVATPEPATFGLMGIGTLLLIHLRRRS
jgi:hypothetical protein